MNVEEIMNSGELYKVGEGAYIQAPYYAMWGGHHVYLGKGVYINYNSVLVDDAEIHIGDGTMIAPNVTIAAASHPVSPILRAKGYSCKCDCNGKSGKSLS